LVSAVASAGLFTMAASCRNAAGDAAPTLYAVPLMDDLKSETGAPDDSASPQGWLRAAVLGADDGIVSTAALIVGVAAANASPRGILTAGLAGLVAGAASMAAGEYVSVSAQRDFERALRRKEERLVAQYPNVALSELSIALQIRGIEPTTARTVAVQLAATQLADAGVRVKYGISEQARARPLQAALASAAAFTAGGVVPIGGAVIAGAAAAAIAASSRSASLARSPPMPAGRRAFVPRCAS
jgi:VIT1/CCC1 family predicted Fe2+/Mn2+ transporter